MQFMVNPSVGGVGVQIVTRLLLPSVLGVVEEWM